MKKKNKSEFMEWFENQFGERPSNKTIYKLTEEVVLFKRQLLQAETLFKRCEVYDSMLQSARYVWDATKRQGNENPSST